MHDLYRGARKPEERGLCNSTLFSFLVWIIFHIKVISWFLFLEQASDKKAVMFNNWRSRDALTRMSCIKISVWPLGNHRNGRDQFKTIPRSVNLENKLSRKKVRLLVIISFNHYIYIKILWNKQNNNHHVREYIICNLFLISFVLKTQTVTIIVMLNNLINLTDAYWSKLTFDRKSL